MILSEAVSDGSMGFRAGARHAAMIFVTAKDEKDTRQKAAGTARDVGWLEADVKHFAALSEGSAQIKDTTLRDSATEAGQNGSTLVVYNEEVPPDA